jgi:DNA-binding MarR family transcriptional regulator
LKQKKSDIQVQYDEIDKIIHEPGRLMILLHLSMVEKADFVYLMKRTGLSKGNLSTHLSKLEEARYIIIEKDFIEKIPRTLLSLTEKGKIAFASYRDTILQLLKSKKLVSG